MSSPPQFSSLLVPVKTYRLQTSPSEMSKKSRKLLKGYSSFNDKKNMRQIVAKPASIPVGGKLRQVGVLQGP